MKSVVLLCIFDCAWNLEIFFLDFFSPSQQLFENRNAIFLKPQILAVHFRGKQK